MRDQDCSGELLRSPTHNGHLLVGALKRHQNKPVLFLGDTRLTGGQLADRISQYIQAFEALGAGTGVAVGLLSLNRPEVLMIIGAGQARGYRRTALHPLGSLADHAYVLNDAGISSLIIDPNPMFVERALALLEQVDSLQQILTIGPVPDALKHVAVDLSAEAAKYQPQPLVAADLPPDQVIGLTYTGGTTGKPKGVIGTAQSIATMTSIQLAEWEWPANPRFLMCTPLSHADAAFFTPTVIKGGEMIVLAKFDPAEVLRIIEEQRITATMLVPSMLYALLDHPDSHCGGRKNPPKALLSRRTKTIVVCTLVCMARLNVYVPDELAERARARGLNVSALTQAAISAELENSATDAWLEGLEPRSTGARHDDVLGAIDAARDEFEA